MQRSQIVLAMAAVFGLTTTTFARAQQQPTPQTPPSQQASPAPAAATTDSHSGLPSFDDLDKQHRGALSRSDIPKDVDGLKPLRAHFLESDKDHNGRLSPSEYAAYTQSQMPESEKMNQGN